MPLCEARAEYEIKKSRFIALAFNATSREQAMHELALIKRRFSDARHHCWAYLIGPPNSPKTASFNDDGEPSGTAGKPILNVLNHKNVGDIGIVVVRYFGGIKLGAGGLVRAYSTAAQQVMEVVKTETKIALTDLHLSGDFSLEQPLRHWLSTREGAVEALSYTDKITAHIRLRYNDRAECERFVLSHGGALLEGA